MLCSCAILFLSLSAGSLWAADAAATAKIDSGDNAWMLMSSALVLMMTAPGLILFYGGLVRNKNVLSTMMHSLVLMGLMSAVWMVFGYSLAFGEGNAFFGNPLQYLFLNDFNGVRSLYTIYILIFHNIRERGEQTGTKVRVYTRGNILVGWFCAQQVFAHTYCAKGKFVVLSSNANRGHFTWLGCKP